MLMESSMLTYPRKCYRFRYLAIEGIHSGSLNLHLISTFLAGILGVGVKILKFEIFNPQWFPLKFITSIFPFFNIWSELDDDGGIFHAVVDGDGL
jgi:hypothetical protein